MEASKKERVILYGIVPIVAAVAGAVVGAWATRAFGATPPADAVLAIIRLPGLTVNERAKLIELATTDTAKFYSLMNYILAILPVPIGILAWATADWIRKH